MQNYSEVLSCFRHCCPYILQGRRLTPGVSSLWFFHVSSHQIISEHLPCIDTLYTVWPTNGMTVMENRSYDNAMQTQGRATSPS